MKPVVKVVVFCLLLAGGARRPEIPEQAGIVRALAEQGVALTVSLSETNLQAGATAVLELAVEAPVELVIDFKRLSFDGFLVFAEEHPAYTASGDGLLIYRHLYHLQARRPGTPSIPEIKVRVRDPLKADAPRELALPPLPLTVRGMDVKSGEELQWSEPAEVTL